MSTILELVRQLYPFPYSVVGSGNDDALKIFRSELPFSVHEYPSGAELNGWRVPPAWHVREATITREGQLVADGRRSPLGVIAQSASFSGSVSLEELKRHLFSSDEDPDATVYQWERLYRPSAISWGFCLPRRVVESLTEGLYQVELRTHTQPGTMKVLDYVLPGTSPTTIVLNAHNCHPFQANDDISGCAVGIEVMKRLTRLSTRRFGYRLLIAPELVGTVFWLDSLGAAAANLNAAILLKSVGRGGRLRLQESFTGTSSVDAAARYAFKRRLGKCESGPFRTIYGNDETAFEAPGFEVPAISLTRWPFDGYHTDRDTPDHISDAMLEEAAALTFDICLALEQNVRLERLFRGLVSLSHPRYDLYRRAPAPGVETGDYTEDMAKWNRLMNCLPRYLDGKTGLLDLAVHFDLPLADVHAYALQWVDKGLASIVD